MNDEIKDAIEQLLYNFENNKNCECCTNNDALVQQLKEELERANESKLGVRLL